MVDGLLGGVGGIVGGVLLSSQLPLRKEGVIFHTVVGDVEGAFNFTRTQCTVKL